MSRKQNRRNSPALNTAAKGADAGLLPEEIARVREQIAGRHSKTALQLAKDLYKHSATPESEALLTDAYKARIDDLLKLGMTVEAKTLLGIVRERFPSALPRLTDLGREISAQDGKLEEVVAPLADPELPAGDRERIESFIRQRIHDLPALAGVSSLPPEHSLRTAASAVAAALQAVTSGPVEDAVLALPEVSRRSPLATWKAMIRAIGCYYRREDEECHRWLQTIPIDSVPARLLPAFAAMLRTEPVSGAEVKLSLAEEKLVSLTADHGTALRAALTSLEDALRERKQKQILDAARKAMAASQHCGPEVRDRLRQHIAVRADLQQVSRLAVESAMGGAPRVCAYYLRLQAMGLEEQGHVDAHAEAALAWAGFRREAIKEKWFASGGLEDGILSLHMGQLIEKVPEELIDEIRAEMGNYRKPRDWDKNDGLPSPGALYERACKADPHPEVFQAWLSWARKNESGALASEVAEQWRKARATDIQPLLYLMESAEKRNAFKKSLKYLEAAENLDRLNPEVRRAKLRLLLSAALRHLQQRMTHLALKEIEQIETVPEVRPGEIAALAAALRWSAAAGDRDKAAQDEQEAQLNRLMGSVAAHLLIVSVAGKAEMLFAVSSKVLKAAKIPAAELLAGVAKARALGDWAGLPIELPREWIDPLMAAMKPHNCPADTAQMLVVGEAALDGYSAELAFTVSVAGLAKGGANAESLFLRARSLPSLSASVRREGCLTASLELARRERNTALAGRILDLLNGNNSSPGKRWRPGSNFGDDPEIASRAVSPELLAKILEEELSLKKFPGYGFNEAPKYSEDLNASLCDCPKCRARRGETGAGGYEFVDDGDEDDFEDEDDDFADPGGFALSELLKGLGKMMGLSAAKIKELEKARANGEDPKTAMDRILGERSFEPRAPETPKSRKTEKSAKVPPPEQGSLF